MKIFGREPAALLTLVAVLVKMLAAFGMDVSSEQQAVVNAVAAAAVGVAVAYTVHDGLGAALLGFVQAVVALAVGFGLDWSAEKQAVVLSVAAAVVAMWDRTQVTAPVSAAALKRPVTPVS
ncbi:MULTISPECIES: hypothetical protein [unclassified Streptomyces]|uniref:hypothetical protein n=1 Tax=Streptomyces TaxID=1883 RepID=UPI00088F5C9C|nr:MULTISPECIES: hypothetical protein [unclassified Streptomyces]PBC72234.1 hypothetical protein BX261_7317 [Streptomyces sp. 2321.6]SDR62027.1 hypothetical protein SAMN05216511_7252 [Streptomyces sp. KS_16]SEE49671.1 hypothetical protein SAMN05428940_7301 [Streptomyces sp. 2133.1]SNC77870.1 hypothetical protein SAMN06272741_7287 [Streptomyces sp. 2114.4]